jgi:trimethylamine:corrinoid methyltransferase-like protein
MVLPHTAKNLRKVTHYPSIGVRGFRSKWINDGKPNAAAQAGELAKKILSKPNPNQLAADIDKKVRDHIADLPEGLAYWYK